MRETKSDTISREFGTDSDVEKITGRKRRTLQKDRLLGRGFPFYRVGRKILYDLNEVRRLVRSGRVVASFLNKDAVNPQSEQPRRER